MLTFYALSHFSLTNCVQKCQLKVVWYLLPVKVICKQVWCLWPYDTNYTDARMYNHKPQTNIYKPFIPKFWLIHQHFMTKINVNKGNKSWCWFSLWYLGSFLLQAHVVMDTVRQQSKGYGFVTFPCRRSTELALIWWGVIFIMTKNIGCLAGMPLRI